MGCPGLTIYDYFRIEYPAFSPDKMDVIGSVSPIIVNPSITVNGEHGTMNENGPWVKEAVPLTRGENDILATAKDMFDREKTETRKVTLLPSPVFSYDANGNMTSDGLWQYTWNDENRMTSATSVSSLLKIENVYDGLGRRRIKKVYNSDSNTNAWFLLPDASRQFVYDGVRIIAQSDTAGTISQRFIWNGDQLLALEDLILGETFYCVTDGNRNVVAYTDAEGRCIAHYEYSPFGKIVSQSGSYADTNPFRFSSEYFDKETGLIAFLYRDYSPEYARWLSREPIGELGSINLYQYLDNTPLNDYDILGLRGAASRRNMVEPYNANLRQNAAMTRRAFERLHSEIVGKIEQIPNARDRQNFQRRLNQIPTSVITSSDSRGDKAMAEFYNEQTMRLRELSNKIPAETNQCSAQRKAYRVMSQEEFEQAKLGKYEDGPFPPTDAGEKWVWPTKEQAQAWKDYLERHGEKLIITEIPTYRPLTQYEAYPHETPLGPAYLVPTGELGPATPLD